MNATCAAEYSLTRLNDVTTFDVLFGLMTISILWTYVSILTVLGFTWREKFLAFIILMYTPSVYFANMCSNQIHNLTYKNT